MSDGAPIKSGQYAAKKAEYAKSSIRAKVEHVFGVVKKQLHFRKTRYRGLEKQRAKFNIMFAPANLILAFMQCCLSKNTPGRRHGRVRSVGRIPAIDYRKALCHEGFT